METMEQICTTHGLTSFSAPRGWRGLVWTGWEDEFKDLDQWLLQQNGTFLVDKPNRSVRRIETSRGTLYVKEIVRLADGRHFLRDILKKIRWYVRPSRALRVARISEAMLRDGVGCPVPVLSVRRRSCLGVPHDVMVSIGLPYPSVDDMLKEQGENPSWEFLEAVAEELARIHLLGYVHGDCMAGNLLWDGSRLYFIDNDRTFKLSGLALHRHCVKNMIQICRSVEWNTRSLESGERFMELYNSHCEPAFLLDKSTRRKIQAQVRRQLVHCNEKYGKGVWMKV